MHKINAWLITLTKSRINASQVSSSNFSTSLKYFGNWILSSFTVYATTTFAALSILQKTQVYDFLWRKFDIHLILHCAHKPLNARKRSCIKLLLVWFCNKPNLHFSVKKQFNQTYFNHYRLILVYPIDDLDNDVNLLK